MQRVFLKEYRIIRKDIYGIHGIVNDPVQCAEHGPQEETRAFLKSATPSKKPPALEVPLLIADLQVNVIDYLFYPGNFSADTPER